MEQNDFIRLLSDLPSVYHAEWSLTDEQQREGEIRALRAMQENNARLIQEHFEEVLNYINYKRPCVEKLARMNEELEQQIARLSNRSEMKKRGA